MKEPSQKAKLLELLKDGLPHNTPEILEVVYGNAHLGLARVGARVADLKADGYTIRGWDDDENRTIYWYQLLSSPKEAGVRPTEAAEEAVLLKKRKLVRVDYVMKDGIKHAVPIFETV